MPPLRRCLCPETAQGVVVAAAVVVGMVDPKELQVLLVCPHCTLRWELRVAPAQEQAADAGAGKCSVCLGEVCFAPLPQGSLSMFQATFVRARVVCSSQVVRAVGLTQV